MKRFIFTIFSALMTLFLLFQTETIAAEINWNSAKRLYPGFKLVKVKKRKPLPLRYYIIQVDLETPGLDFVTTGRDKDWGKPMPDCPKFKIRTKRMPTAEFMQKIKYPEGKKKKKKGKNIVVAVNATPWRPWENPFTHKYAEPPGLMISEGVVVVDRKPAKPMLVIYKDGKVEIKDNLSQAERKKVRHALPGFAIIAKDGEILNSARKNKDRHPRTAFGLSKDRRYLYIIAIDGRQKKWSMGADYTETATYLIEAGASDVINMDGGGSVSMCYWHRSKRRPVMINRHDTHGSARSVASSLGFIINK